MKDMIYLDNAATAWPKPAEVYDKMIEFYRNHGVNPGRSGFDEAISAGDMVENTRKRLCDFFHGDLPERTSFCYNATDGLNLVINGLVEKGDHVISTSLEHNSVLRPLNCLERDGICELTWLPFDGQGFIDPEDVLRAIRPNTKLIVVNHGSNVIGTIQDLAAIGRVAKENGVLFVADCSQTAGVLPIDMQEMNLDVLVFTGHKAMMGPTGIGGVIIRDGVDVRQTRAGGTGVRSAYPYHLPEYPYRLEYGTVNLVGIAGLWYAQEWIQRTGLENIYAHERELLERFVHGIRDIDNLEIYNCEDTKNHLSTVSVNIEGVEAMNTGTILDVDYNIATRTGLQCAPKVHQQIGTIDIHGTVRFSIGYFNTPGHVDTAIQALKDIAADPPLAPK